ncbi:MAG TPA: glycosyltransferase family 4 protein [Dermatophilaceae bacterium]|nr:glycosyltransferase family 4 protein [Dermatophilaceae bacterium]
MTNPKRVLMLVGNDIRNDTRVLKSALALADGGLDVTVLGYGSDGVREDTQLGGVRILRIPVDWRSRDDAGLRGRESQSRIKNAGDLSPRQILRRWLAKLETRAWWMANGVRHRSPLWANWRRVLPEIDDYERSFGPVIDQLEWEVLHAHDVHLVGIAKRAVDRRRGKGAQAAWVYDAHEFVAGLSVYGSRTRRRVAGYENLESEFIRDADGVVTVTEPLARELQRRYQLSGKPAVVMNSPVLGAAARPIEVGIRAAVGLADGVPLVVYSGGVTAARGVATAVAALPQLPGVHLAVVCVPNTATEAVKLLVVQATALGVADRLHLLEPVRPDEVSAFVASADVGLLPLRHFGSHEMALANKLFEYLYATIPVLVSDCRAQADFVRSHGVGAVHIADDASSFATELRGLLARRAEVVKVIASSPDLLEPFAWERQEATLRDFYRQLLGSPDAVHEPTSRSTLEGLTEVPRPLNLTGREQPPR